jgi:hypothetical protein
MLVLKSTKSVETILDAADMNVRATYATGRSGT